MITNRHELIEEFLTRDCPIYPRIDGLTKKVIERYHDWLSEQGFALVPKEPTEEMLNAHAWVGEGVTREDDPDIDRLMLHSANVAGDLLKRREL